MKVDESEGVRSEWLGAGERDWWGVGLWGTQMERRATLEIGGLSWSHVLGWRGVW